MLQKNPVHLTAFALVTIGALNWGLIGLGYLLGGGANWNVIYMLLGTWPTVEAVVYIVVGLAAVYKLATCSKGRCGSCTTAM